ncbi:MAG: aminoglycoside phosphotransferase family protein [Caldilineaceae bacterium]
MSTETIVSVESCRQLLAEIEPKGQWISVRPMGADGTHPAFVIEAQSAAGAPFSIAVKCYQSGFGRDRERASLEFQTLRLLQQHDVPVAVPLLLDEAGTFFGLPSIVTSFVTGKQQFTADDPTACVHELAQTLAKIHAVPIGTDEKQWLQDANHEVLWFRHKGKLPDYMVTYPAGLQIWNKIEQLLPQQQSVIPTFVHTDYWIGQVLWDRGRITAVLDWEEAGYGDPGYDLAYCYMDLFLSPLGSAPAEQFLRFYEAEVGHPIANLELWQYAVVPRVLHNPDWLNACRPELDRYIASL